MKMNFSIITQNKILNASILPLILIAAFISRFIMAVTIFSSTIDTSTVGIMGIRILEGDRPIFYYGQNYMGALEAYGTALMFKLFGASTTTLTLTPALFAVAWAWSMYLVFKRLFCKSAGLAAALCVAIPGWYAIWYTMGAYGGYPETYLFGTLAIWVCLKFADPKTPDFSIGNSLLLGLLLALGVWTNLQVIPFFAVAAIIAGVNWLFVNRSIKRLLSLAAAGVIGLSGLLPGYYVTKGTEDPGLVELPNLGMILTNFSIMTDRVLPRLLWWKSTNSLSLKWTIALIVILPVLYYLISLLVSLVRRKIAYKIFVPLIFTVLFLAMYLPHSMASLGAPRYMISVTLILISAGFGSMLCSGKKAVKNTGMAFLLMWTAYNGISITHKCITSASGKTEKVAARMELINAAEDHGLENVMIVGSGTEGLRGLILSFYSAGKINFISCYDDRVYQHSDAWEKDDNAAFAFSPGTTRHVTGSLEAMGIKEYILTNTPKYTLLDEIQPMFSKRKSVVGATVTDIQGFDGSTDAITDNTASTSISTKTDRKSSFTVDCGKQKKIDSIRIFSIDDDLSIGPYTISVSLDGSTYTNVQNINCRMPQSYQCGNRIYFRGHYAAQDCCFAPVTARYLRIEYPEKGGRISSWNISEIMVFEHISNAGVIWPDEITKIAAEIKSRKVQFTYCDRWLSAKLVPLLSSKESEHSVFPTHNTRHPHSEFSRKIIAAQGKAIAVHNSMAQQAIALLKESLPEGSSFISHEFTNYTLLVFDGDEEKKPSSLQLVWNGHTIYKE